jgi:hypothetical protein
MRDRSPTFKHDKCRNLPATYARRYRRQRRAPPLLMLNVNRSHLAVSWLHGKDTCPDATMSDRYPGLLLVPLRVFRRERLARNCRLAPPPRRRPIETRRPSRVRDHIGASGTTRLRSHKRAPFSGHRAAMLTRRVSFNLGMATNILVNDWPDSPRLRPYIGWDQSDIRCPFYRRDTPEFRT